MKLAFYCTALLGLLVSPALAGIIDVSISPAIQNVPLSNGTTTVQLVANIPADDPLIAYSIDLIIIGASATWNPAATVVGPGFDAAFHHDNDGVSGIVHVPPGSISGNGVVLATLGFNLVGLGATTVSPGITEGDPFEGLTTVGLDFAPHTLHAGVINVIPEPATLALLGLGMLLRRR
jgi:hypothetical protein